MWSFQTQLKGIKAPKAIQSPLLGCFWLKGKAKKASKGKVFKYWFYLTKMKRFEKVWMHPLLDSSHRLATFQLKPRLSVIRASHYAFLGKMQRSAKRKRDSLCEVACRMMLGGST